LFTNNDIYYQKVTLYRQSECHTISAIIQQFRSCSLIRSSDRSSVDCLIWVYVLSGRGRCCQGADRRGRLERL